MEDKTAAIPSLKDFKGNNKGKKSTNGRQKKSAPQKKVSRDTMRIDTIKSATNSASQGRQGQKSTGSHSHTGSASRSRSASAPSTYARDRLQNKAPSQGRNVQSRPSQGRARSAADYDSSRRIDRTAQAERRDNLQAKKPAAPKGRPSSSYYYDDTPAVKRQQSTGQRKPAENKPVSNSYGTSQRKPVQKSSARQRPVQKKTAGKKSGQPLTPAKRKARNIIIMVSMILVILIVLGVLSLTVFFKTKSFEVYGIDRYTSKEIILASGLNEGDNIFTANKSRAEDRIEQMCPYVETADVYAVFPDAIGIDLTMAKPACRINAIGGCYIISDKGKVLEVTASDDEADVPLLEGVQIKGRAPGEFVDFGSQVLTDALSEMFEAFNTMGSSRITEIDIITKGDIFEIRYVYDDRIVVYLGIPEEISYKLKAANVIIKDHLDAEDNSTIAGELDVSDCHETGNSYFNEYSILAPDVAAKEETTTVTEEPTEVYYY